MVFSAIFYIGECLALPLRMILNNGTGDILLLLGFSAGCRSGVATVYRYTLFECMTRGSYVDARLGRIHTYLLSLNKKYCAVLNVVLTG